MSDKVQTMRIVVTGASSGIGSELSQLLARNGHALVLAARRTEALTSVAEACRAAGAPEVAVVQWDASNHAHRGRLTRGVEELSPNGELGLVNAAGVAIFGEFATSDFNKIEEMVLTNLLGTMSATRELLPLMLADRSGQVINVLSISATQSFPGAAGYCASKAGALAFTRALNAEVRTKGVRVSAVIPGAVDTPLWDGKGWVPPREDMLTPQSVAEAIRDLMHMPRDRSVDELHLMPPLGVL